MYCTKNNSTLHRGILQNRVLTQMPIILFKLTALKSKVTILDYAAKKRYSDEIPKQVPEKRLKHSRFSHLSSGSRCFSSPLVQIPNRLLQIYLSSCEWSLLKHTIVKNTHMNGWRQRESFFVIGHRLAVCISLDYWRESRLESGHKQKPTERNAYIT